MRMLIILAAMILSNVALSLEANDEPSTAVTTNQELPKILYVIPWKDIANGKNVEQKLVLHDLFNEIYDPALPSIIEKEGKD